MGVDTNRGTQTDKHDMQLEMHFAVKNVYTILIFIHTVIVYLRGQLSVQYQNVHDRS